MIEPNTGDRADNRRSAPSQPGFAPPKLRHKKANLGLALLVVAYIIGLIFFYIRYVPFVGPFQMILIPILSLAFLLTLIHLQSGLLFFVFVFPLINNLPYFFGISENIPHAPTALVLFLFFFLGFLLRRQFSRSSISFKDPIMRPLILFSLTILLSAVITFLRYANFYPFVGDAFYELRANVVGVSAGGALMSVVLFSLNYLSAMAFFFVFVNVVNSRTYLKKILAVLCLSTLVSLGFGLFQHLKNSNLGNNPLSIRLGLINATFKDALSFGAYIAIVAPLLAGLTLTAKGTLRVLSFLTLPAAAYLILFSGSKVSLLALLLSLLVFSFLTLKVGLSLWRSRPCSLRRMTLSSWIVVVLIFVILIGLIGFKDQVAENVISSVTLSRLKDFQTALEYRVFNLGKLAASMMKDFPLTGLGVGSFIIEVSNYAKPKSIYIEPESAENYLLQAGSELGLIGVLLVLWILWEILSKLKRSYSTIPATDKDKFILIGAIAGIISFLAVVQAHTFIGSYEIKYSFWLLVGIVFCLGRTSEGKEEDDRPKPLFDKKKRIVSLIVLSLFCGVHLWNSTHSLSLKDGTDRLGIKQDFGFYEQEKTNDGREFRWTREYGGMTVRIEKPIIGIPLLASHPDISTRPIKVEIYLIKDFFGEKIRLGEVTLNQSVWETHNYDARQELGLEVILLVKVSRTWNPLKTLGTPDPRNLGVAMGRIEFKETMGY